MKADGRPPKTAIDAEPVLAAELVAVALAAVSLPLLPVPSVVLSVPKPETTDMAEIAAPLVVEEPAAAAVPVELVAVELAIAVPLLPVPQPVLAVPAPATTEMAELVAPPVVAEAVAAEVVEPVAEVAAPVAEVAAPVAEVAEPVVIPAEPVLAAVLVVDQVERVSWLRRLRSLIALIFLAALLGATLAAVVIGIGVLITLAAQHALG